VRFFVDENLSPTLAIECRGAGYDATSVRDRSMLKATDREVSELCFEEDRILVTNNGVDFLDLAEQSGLHPGLVFIPLGSGAEMRGSMRLAIGEIERLAADAEKEPKSLMVNSVLEVDEDGACERFDHPSPQGEPSGADRQDS
jgi:predicted nuclease of predicted toxin-antitoxin system